MDSPKATHHRLQVEEFRCRHRTGLVTLLFTDIVESTALKHTLGDHAGTALIQQHRALVRELLHQFPESEEIETAGDSFFLAFSKPSEAVTFALRLEHRQRQLGETSGHPVALRIGIHLGEVVIEDHEAGQKTKDLYGVQIDTCARVMSLAKANQVLMGRGVFDIARQVLKGEDLEGIGLLEWLNHGPYLLKGIEEPVEVCEVREAGQAGAPGPPTSSEKAQRQVRADEEPVLGWRPAVGQVVPNTKWVLEQKLGEGGFGEVWLGRHQTMKERRVFKFCFRADRVRSLKREMTLFRVLKERMGDHRNIVRLLEVHFEEPPFYVVMDYVAGKDLKAWCEQQGGVEKVPLAVRLEIVAQIADALQAAHDAGVIHRDVKPGNILVSEQWSVISGQKTEDGSQKAETGGQRSEGRAQKTQDIDQSTDFRSLTSDLRPLVVKLTDFGIGQVVSEECLAGVTKAGFTQTIVADSSSSRTGTQLYLAPELLAGKPASIRSDIYSLGVVLYQLLVGDFTRPITTDWAEDIADPLLREDLKHCFAGKPEERFAGASQLASNLRSLPARTAARVEQEAELAARERAAYRQGVLRMAGLAAAITITVTVLALVALHQSHQAKIAARQLHYRAYASDMKTAQVALEQNNRGMALSLLRRYVPQPKEEDLRGIEWRYLWQQSRGDEVKSFALPKLAMVDTAALTPDGRYLATASHDAKTRVWEVTTEKLIHEFDTTSRFGNQCKSLGISPDGKWLAAAGTNGITVWDAAHWQVVQELPYAARPLVFSPEGTHLVTAQTNEVDGLLVWDVTTWKPRTLTNAWTGFNLLAFTPDGGRLACLERRSGQIALWNIHTGTRTTLGAQHNPFALAISPDGKWLAFGDREGKLTVWELSSLQKVINQHQAHRGFLLGLAFSPDSRLLATGGLDVIHLWEAGTTNPPANLPATLRGHLAEIWSLEFSRDGQSLVSGSKDGTAKLWSIQPHPLKSHTFNLPPNVVPVGPLSDGSALVTSDEKTGTIELRRLLDGQLLRSFGSNDFQTQGCRKVNVFPGSQCLVGISINGTVHLWDVATGAPLRSAPLRDTNFVPVAVSRDYHWLLGGQLTNNVGTLYDLKAGQTVRQFPECRWAWTFSQDGRWLAYRGSRGEIKIWDLATDREHATLPGHRWVVTAMQFSPDGKLLASGGGDDDVWLWSVETGKPLAFCPLRGHQGIIDAVVFSADGRTLISGAEDWTIRCWSLATGQEMLLLNDLRSASQLFTSDWFARGNTLVFQARQQRIWVTTLPTLAEIEALEKVQRRSP